MMLRSTRLIRPNLRLNQLLILRFNNTYAYIQDFPTLQSKIKSNISSDSSSSDILQALSSIKNLQPNYTIHDQLDENSEISKESI